MGNAEYTVLLSRCLPDTLESLRVFQESKTATHPVRPSVSQDRALAKALARGGRNLRTLSASFLVDAATFLPDFRRPMRFPYFARLTILSLTAQCLNPSARTRNINALLSSACCAIYHMPMLQIMQIWNAGRGRASYLIFWRPGPRMCTRKDLLLKHGKTPFVKFYSTWRLNLHAAVAYWEEHGLSLFLPYQPPKLDRDTQCLLQTSQINVRRTVDDTYSYMLPYLPLQVHVISSTSRQEIGIEHLAGAA